MRTLKSPPRPVLVHPFKFRTWMRFRDGSANWEHWSDAYEHSEIKS
jgi:hypothetical protein